MNSKIVGYKLETEKTQNNRKLGLNEKTNNCFKSEGSTKLPKYVAIRLTSNRK
jgi:hypothetical protein